MAKKKVKKKRKIPKSVNESKTPDLDVKVLEPRMVTEGSSLPKPEIKQEPPPVIEKPILSETPVIDGMQADASVSSNPAICMGCKGRYNSDIMKSCSNCKGAPAYCPACVLAGTCHRCGKEI